MTSEKALRARWFSDRIPRLAADSIVFGFLWFAIDAMAHLRLRPSELLALSCAWLAPHAVSCAGEALRPGWGWTWVAVRWALPLPLAAMMSQQFRYVPSLGVLAYAAVFVPTLRALWARWGVSAENAVAAELCRRLLVGAACTWAVLPFFTDLFLGGTDARWYSYMLADVMEQFRAGVFPVFVGQSEYAFNGAVHPVRSAPIHLWLGAFWDLATCRALSIPAVQHLTAITAAFVAGWGMYVSLRSLVGTSPWSAALCAMVYILSPAILCPLYTSDMYMTFTAIAVFPFLAAANARAAREPSGSHFSVLAATLALLWMCHPPSALLGTLATLVVQTVAWSTSERTVGSIVPSAAVGAISFAGLGAYYFATMSELPPRPGAPLSPDVLAVGAIAASWIAGVRGGLNRQWSWTFVGVASVVLLSRLNPAWAIWATVFILSCWCVPIVLRARAFESWRLPLSLGLAVFSIAIALLLCRTLKIAAEESFLAGSRKMAADWTAAFKPLTPRVGGAWDFQPGWAVYLACLMGIGLGLRRNRVALILAFVGATVFALLLGVPAVTEFLVGYVPPGIGRIGGIPLAIRIFPVAVACCVVAGFLGIATLQQRLRAATVAILVIAVGWSAWEARKIVDRGNAIISKRAVSERGYLPENVILHRYAYDLLPVSPYHADARLEPELEVRLLKNDQEVLYGPDQIARKMESFGSQSFEWTVHPFDPDGAWLKLAPGTTVDPGEIVLMRFEFDPGLSYNGYLIGQNVFGDYREYFLPLSGNELAFGTPPASSKVIAMRNSTEYVTPYDWSHSLRPGHSLVGDGRRFATVTVSNYVAARSLVDVESWIPLRVRVSMPEPGFIETPRVFLPGYRAVVNGQKAPVTESKHRLVMIPLSPGDHVVELRYVGTLRVWLAGGVSAAAWTAFVVWRRRVRQDTASTAAPV
jgi:hypothetical protein